MSSKFKFKLNVSSIQKQPSAFAFYFVCDTMTVLVVQCDTVIVDQSLITLLRCDDQFPQLSCQSEPDCSSCWPGNLWLTWPITGVQRAIRILMEDSGWLWKLLKTISDLIQNFYNNIVKLKCYRLSWNWHVLKYI